MNIVIKLYLNLTLKLFIGDMGIGNYLWLSVHSIHMLPLIQQL